MYEQTLVTEDQEAQTIIKGISPVAWQHVNLFGSFEFRKTSKVDIDALVACYADQTYWSKALKGEITPPLV